MEADRKHELVSNDKEGIQRGMAKGGLWPVEKGKEEVAMKTWG